MKCRTDQKGAVLCRPHRLPTKRRLTNSASRGSAMGTAMLVISAAPMLLNPMVLRETSNTVARKTVMPGIMPTEARSFSRKRARKIDSEGRG